MMAKLTRILSSSSSSSEAKPPSVISSSASSRTGSRRGSLQYAPSSALEAVQGISPFQSPELSPMCKSSGLYSPIAQRSPTVLQTGLPALSSRPASPIANAAGFEFGTTPRPAPHFRTYSSYDLTGKKHALLNGQKPIPISARSCIRRSLTPTPSRKPNRAFTLEHPSLHTEEESCARQPLGMATNQPLPLKRTGSASSTRKAPAAKLKRLNTTRSSSSLDVKSALSATRPFIVPTPANAHLRELFGEFVVPPSFREEAQCERLPKLARTVSRRAEASVGSSDENATGVLSPTYFRSPACSRKQSRNRLKADAESDRLTYEVPNTLQDLEARLRNYVSTAEMVIVSADPHDGI